MLMKGKYDKYWKKVDKDNSLSKDLKDLLQKMMCPVPKKRILISEIKKHPWIINTTYDKKIVIQKMVNICQGFDEKSLISEEIRTAASSKDAGELLTNCKFYQKKND